MVVRSIAFCLLRCEGVMMAILIGQSLASQFFYEDWLGTYRYVVRYPLQRLQTQCGRTISRRNSLRFFLFLFLFFMFVL